MRRVLFCATVLGPVVLCCALSPAASVTMGFDDIQTSGIYELDYYWGFNWETIRVLNSHWNDPEPSGFANGAVSPENLAFNYAGADGWMRRQNGEEIDFNSAYLISGWRIGLNVDVIGYRDGAQVYQKTITGLSNQTPELYDFGFLNVDEVFFHAYGGTADPDYPFSSTAFGMDDIVFNNVPTLIPPGSQVPEPLTAGCALLGLLAIAGYLRKRTLA